MTAAQKGRIISRAQSAGYTGSANLGRVSAWADATARTGANARQRRTATSISNTLSGSA